MGLDEAINILSESVVHLQQRADRASETDRAIVSTMEAALRTIIDMHRDLAAVREELDCLKAEREDLRARLAALERNAAG